MQNISTPRVRAPELPQDGIWLNNDRPLSLRSLRGRVVLLDFWTYCCINCLHILPTLKYLEQRYKQSLNVIGIHTAKFDNEAEIESIRQAILRYDIEHPVLVDRDFSVWQQYAVRAYPTLVVIDPAGYVVGTVVGEGDRDALEDLIAQLIHAHQTSDRLNQEIPLLLEKQRQPLLTPLAFPGKVLADEASDRLFVADSGHHRIVVSTLAGEVLHTIGSGTGFSDGSFDTAQFSAPQGMALDAQGYLYVADTGNHALRRVDLRSRTVETIAGTGVQSRILFPHGGLAKETPLNSPWDVTLIENRLYCAMAGSHQLWELTIDAGQVQTYTGTGAEACVDGPPTEAAFAQPSGITHHGSELFVADSESSSIRAVIGTVPQVRTICGSGDLYGFGDRDGVGAAVLLQHCLGVEFAHGALWIADTYNHKLKQVDPKTGACKTIAGTGQAGLRDGAEAQFAEPSGLSATSTHLYVADTNNHAIRRLDFATLTVETVLFPGLCSPDVCFPVGL